MKKIKRSKLNPIYSETIYKKYPRVIDEDKNTVHQFVGIGWVDEGKPSQEDKITCPVIVE